MLYFIFMLFFPFLYCFILFTTSHLGPSFLLLILFYFIFICFCLGILDGWFLYCWFPGAIKWGFNYPLGRWCQHESPYVKGLLKIFFFFPTCLSILLLRDDAIFFSNEISRIWFKKLNFICFQKADRDFIVSLLSLIRNFRRAVELHEDLAQSTLSPAELITGCFDGFKVVQPIILLVLIF